MSPSDHSRRAVLRRIGATSTLSIGVALAGCSSDGGDGGGGTTIAMTGGLSFDPDALTVDAGTTVTWENTGGVGHTVTAYEDDILDEAAYFASGGFDSEEAARGGYPEGTIAEGESYEHAFETTGTYEYFCIPHEGGGMTGSITVE